MAKTMALIENGVVSNILWCSDKTQQTNSWIDLVDRPVSIGDIYNDGKFYRKGIEVLTPLEVALNENLILQEENLTLINNMAQMVDEVYQSDIEMMGI